MQQGTNSLSSKIAEIKTEYARLRAERGLFADTPSSGILQIENVGGEDAIVFTPSTSQGIRYRPITLEEFEVPVAAAQVLRYDHKISLKRIAVVEHAIEKLSGQVTFKREFAQPDFYRLNGSFALRIHEELARSTFTIQIAGRIEPPVWNDPENLLWQNAPSSLGELVAKIGQVERSQ